MTSLPAGWAADYDGQRWFFKYAATNHVQYHFPKPGDEFPDFASFGGGFDALGLAGVLPVAELLPEERLESERQVRRHETLDSNGGGSNDNNTGSRSKSKRKKGPRAAEHESEDRDGMFSFESFGYLGPGSYLDVAVSPVMEKASVHLGARAESLASVGGVSSMTPPPASVSMVSTPPISIDNPPGGACAPLANPPVVAHQQQQVHPPAPVPTTQSQSQPLSGHAPEAMVPMLDGRAVFPSPVGCIAELVSESTARCREEICPAPVELPDNGASWLEPVPVPNLVNQYPVELPAALELGTKGGEQAATGRDERRPGESHMAPRVYVEKRKKQQQQDFCKVDREGVRHDVARDSVAGLNLRNPSGHLGPSAQAPPQPPPRPSKPEARSDLPSRQAQGPQVPPKVPHDEWLHQEILDFFPEASQVPRPLQIGIAKPVPGPIPETEVRRLSMSSSSTKLGPVPSILRPGPRRSSQPSRPGPGAWSDTRRLSQSPIPDALRPGMGMHTTSLPAPGNTATYRPYQPLRPLTTPAAGKAHSSPVTEGSHIFTEQCAPLRPQSFVAPAADRTQSSPDVHRPYGRSSISDQDIPGDCSRQPLQPQKKPLTSTATTGRPHAQSLVERPRDPAPRTADVPHAVMPDPGDHVRALRLTRSNTTPSMGEDVDGESLSSSSPAPRPQQAAAARHGGSNPRASMYFTPGGHGQRQFRSSPVKFVVPASHHPLGDALQGQPGPGPDPEPSSFVRMPSARASLLSALQLKMPSEPAVPTTAAVQPQTQHILSHPAPVHSAAAECEHDHHHQQHQASSSRTSQSPSTARASRSRDSDFGPPGSPEKIEETSSPPQRQAEQASSASASSSSSSSISGADERSPKLPGRRFTYLTQIEGAGGPGDKSFKNMLRRVARPGGLGESGGEPIQVVGEEEPGDSPMDYIPPKGKKGEAAEWSWGHAE